MKPAGWTRFDHPLVHRMAISPNCICGEWDALHNRHLKEQVPQIILRPTIKFVTPTLVKTSFHDIISGYRGAKRRVYFRAAEDLGKELLSSMDARVDSFVKVERQSAPGKAPRLIQHRSPKFNLVLATYLKPFERWFYDEYKHEGIRCVTKGLNVSQRAALLKDAAESIADPCFLLLDHKHFDSSVTVEHLRMLHAIYIRTFKSKRLAWLLRHQLDNKCRTANGIKYRVKGTRMSGDFDTALGNTLLNYIVIRDCLYAQGIKFKLLIDGDDSVVVLSVRDAGKLDLTRFSAWGFTTKSKLVYDISDVEYCQHFYVDAPTPFFARHPAKVLSSYALSLRYYQGKAFEKYFRGCMMGELHVSRGVPIVGPLVEEQAHGKYILDDDHRYRLTLDPVNINIEESRVAYHRTFGITPTEQVAMEKVPLTPTSEGLVDYFQRLWLRDLLDL